MKLKGDILPLMVLLRPIVKGEQKTDSGIIIPDTADDPTMKSEVMVVGRSTDAVPMDDIQVGRVVLTHPHAGHDVYIGGEKYRLTPYKNVDFIYSEEESQKIISGQNGS